MDQLNKQDIQKLLERYRLGECTAEERERVDAWYNRLEGDEAALAQIDYEEDKADTLVKIRRALPVQRKTVKLWPRIAAAASVIGALIMAFYAYKLFNKPSMEKVEITNAIRPGKVSATLTLANGRKIILNQTANGAIATQTGVTITKNANGQLIYEIVAGEGQDNTQMNTLSTMKGETYQVRLPDGTMVWLNAESAITYPSSFKLAAQRNVKLSGEAYFEVAKDKEHPFIVAAGQQHTQVLGTHFNIHAYADEGNILTTLLEGSIKVTEGNTSDILSPGQQSENVNGKMAVSEVDTEEAVAWKNGYFKFDGDLENTMTKISRWYDIEVIYKNKPDSEIRIGGKISRWRKLSEVLGLLETYGGGVHFELSGRKVIVSK